MAGAIVNVVVRYTFRTVVSVDDAGEARRLALVACLACGITKGARRTNIIAVAVQKVSGCAAQTSKLARACEARCNAFYTYFGGDFAIVVDRTHLVAVSHVHVQRRIGTSKAVGGVDAAVAFSVALQTLPS